MPLPALLQCLVRRSQIVVVIKNAIFEANINNSSKCSKFFLLRFLLEHRCLHYDASEMPEAFSFRFCSLWFRTANKCMPFDALVNIFDLFESSSFPVTLRIRWCFQLDGVLGQIARTPSFILFFTIAIIALFLLVNYSFIYCYSCYGI